MRPHSRHLAPPLACALIASVLATAVPAQQPPAERHKEVTVSSTRTAREQADVPGTVTVFEAQAIERAQAGNIADLIRYEPNVSVHGEGQRRFGNADYNIRGIHGNRVLIQVDGARLADQFSFGTGRDTLDLETLKHVGIVRVWRFLPARDSTQSVAAWVEFPVWLELTDRMTQPR